MRIPVTEFTQKAVEEAMQDYGFEGNCSYNDSANDGQFYVKGGIYRFTCDRPAKEIEVTELVIDIDRYEEDMDDYPEDYDDDPEDIEE